MDDLARDRIPGQISLLDQLRNSGAAQLDARAENAWAVAVKFLSLLESQIQDEEELNRIILSWFKSVKAKDFRKYQRAIRRYRRKDDDESADEA